MRIAYKYERISACGELRKWKSLDANQRPSSWACTRIAMFAGKRSGTYEIDPRGRVRQVQ